MKNTAKRITLLPLVLSLGIVLADQFTKLLIVQNIGLNSQQDIIKVTRDFLWIIHVRNKGAAFSFGSDFQSFTRIITLYALPIVLIAVLLYLIVFSKKWTIQYKYIMAGIVGGGIGNMLDRIFRPDGVVDFVSVKFYGIFGMERWPTFNVADSSVVVCMILWIVFSFFPQNITVPKDHTEKT